MLAGIQGVSNPLRLEGDPIEFFGLEPGVAVSNPLRLEGDRIRAFLAALGGKAGF